MKREGRRDDDSENEVKVKIHETRTSQNEINNRSPAKDGRGDHGSLKLDFYDHQPSSSTVGAVDATLAVGDGGRISTPFRFDVLDPFPFTIR